jgi:excinuclease ABC subunit B
MAKSPNPPRDPAKHTKKDPARPTRSKAHRPDSAPTDPALERLLNPGIEKGTAGMGSGTGLKPPPDNSFERRADRRNEHTARQSTPKGGFDEAPQRGYVARSPLNINAELRQALGFDNSDPNKSLIGGDQSDENAASPPSPRLRGEGRGEGASPSTLLWERPPHPDRFAVRPLPTSGQR